MIKKIVCDLLLENCYIIVKNQKCIIIDPGSSFDKIYNYITSNNLTPLAVILTHGHFDHCISCKLLQQKGIKIYIHKEDQDKLYTQNNLSYLYNIQFNKLNADFVFEEGRLIIDEFIIDVLHTPGHSKGSCCFVYENNVFCGDTIFENGYGRTDFYDGNLIQLIHSIKKLKPYIDSKYNFFYGH